jgi:hypothetical protein
MESSVRWHWANSFFFVWKLWDIIKVVSLLSGLPGLDHDENKVLMLAAPTLP